MKWNEITDGIYDDVPKIRGVIIAALKVEGIEDIFC
jgi:hypothetical protein